MATSKSIGGKSPRRAAGTTTAKKKPTGQRPRMESARSKRAAGLGGGTARSGGRPGKASSQKRTPSARKPTARASGKR